MSNSIFHGLDCKELHHLYNLLCVTAEDAWPSFWCLVFFFYDPEGLGQVSDLFWVHLV